MLRILLITQFNIPGITDEIQGNDPRRSETMRTNTGSRNTRTDGGTGSLCSKNDRSILRKQ